MKLRIVYAALALSALLQLTGCCCWRECWCRRCRREPACNSCCKPAFEDVGPIQPIPDPGVVRPGTR
jgi:hypothetical protein